jgi:UPF0271 protein
MRRKRVLVLDTSSIINGYPAEGTLENFTVPEVVEEAKATVTASSIGVLIDRGVLKVWDASPQSEKSVEKKLGEIGGELSTTDIRLVALAMDLARRGMKPVLLTDDYGLQNLAGVMDLEFKSVATSGIRSVFKWKMICPACGKACGEEDRLCPDCGNALRKTVYRRPL